MDVKRYIYRYGINGRWASKVKQCADTQDYVKKQANWFSLGIYKLVKFKWILGLWWIFEKLNRKN